MIKIDNIISQIESHCNLTLDNYNLDSVSGGSINHSYKLTAADQSFFIKLNQPQRVDMFAAEAAGLEQLRALDCIRIPEVICYGQADGVSYIVLEHIELASLTADSNQLLGRQLAKLHQHSQEFYGWQIDNTIGSTAQYNERHHDWLSFWQRQRLGQQLKFAEQNGYHGQLQKKGQHLLNKIHILFENYTPQPALLHGDLWSGNAACDPQGVPVIFDPACYYGDRETDIAMTELFGGFSEEFYLAYHTQYPLDPGYNSRKKLYNLYHILNHLNLFGGGYLSQAQAMIDQLLAEIK